MYEGNVSEWVLSIDIVYSTSIVTLQINLKSLHRIDCAVHNIWENCVLME